MVGWGRREGGREGIAVDTVDVVVVFEYTLSMYLMLFIKIQLIQTFDGHKRVLKTEP